jgi:hypothetical protein
LVDKLKFRRLDGDHGLYVRRYRWWTTSETESDSPTLSRISLNTLFAVGQTCCEPRALERELVLSAQYS